MTSSTSGVSTSSDSAAPLIVNGLESGIDTSSVIQALLESYQEPITNLQDQQTSLNNEASDYQTLNSDMQSLLSAAQALSTTSQWNLTAAASSDSSVATASSAPGAQTGSITFTVNQLAQANLLASQDGVASTGSIVTDASSLLLATGGEALGFSGFSSSSAGALAAGSHTIEVTQASSAGTITGSTPLPSQTSITTGSNDTLSLSVGGSTYALTLAQGSYDPSQLVAAINSAAATAKAPITASLSSSGALVLSTDEQGSAATITANASDALASLGLSANQSGSGTDAIVTVDGTSTTLSSIDPGAEVTLDAPSGGSIVATVASAPGSSGSLISDGTADAAVVSTGNGSLESVVQAINGSGLGVSASAVQTSSGSYVLQVGASSTGLSGAVSVDTNAFGSGALGDLQTITTAQDALVSVGGSNGYQLSSNTNTFDGLISGTAVTVASTGQATVTVSPDATGEATKVQSLVTAANQALSDIQEYAGYDASTKTGGPLMGSAVVDSLQQAILSAFSSVAGTSGLGNSLAAGISLSSSGTLSFDQSTFEQAYTADPSAISALFAQGGTFSPASGQSADAASFFSAGTDTVAGSYDVDVSQSATQATDTGAVLSSGETSAAEMLSVSQGSEQTTYSVAAGESLSAIAAGLNAGFANAGMTLTASVIDNGTQLQLTSDDYGSAQSFEVASSAPGSGTTGLGGSSAGVAASFTGTDVAGTINGVAATGDGQVLAAPASDPTLQGLSVLVTASGITSATDLGTITYSPGLAQQLASIADTASNSSNGSLTTTIQGLQNEATGLNSQISNYQQLETSQQTLLENEFAKMETTLGTLKNESSQLTSSIDDLAGF